MKCNLKSYPIATFLLLTLILGCTKDQLQPEIITEEKEVESSTQIFDLFFNTDGSSGSSLKFIVLSDIDGETLYDTTGYGLDLKVSLSLDTGVVVNATVGFITEVSFSIVSYSDLKSGSDVDLSRDWEVDSCFQSKPTDGRRATLYVTDVDQYYEVIDPIGASYSNSHSLNGDTLVIEGWASSILSDANYQIAIREQEGIQFKSIVIPRQDWTWDNETQSMNHIISFNDFTSTVKHRIQLEILDEWRIKVNICDKDDGFIAIQSQTSFSNEQDGQSVSVFLNETIDVNKIKLNISGNRPPTGYSYNWIHNGIPSRLDFDTNSDPTFTKLDVNEFNIASTYTYNLNVLTYSTGGQYDWTIVSKGGQKVEFIKPDLPSPLYETYTNLRDKVDNPIIVINTMYRTEDTIDDITKVHKSVIPRNRNNDPDFNYSSKRTRIRM